MKICPALNLHLHLYFSHTYQVFDLRVISIHSYNYQLPVIYYVSIQGGAVRYISVHIGEHRFQKYPQTSFSWVEENTTEQGIHCFTPNLTTSCMVMHLLQKRSLFTCFFRYTIIYECSPPPSFSPATMPT